MREFRERKPQFEIYSGGYFFKPSCPYCGEPFSEQEVDIIKDLDKLINRYLTTNDFVCQDCCTDSG